MRRRRVLSALASPQLEFWVCRYVGRLSDEADASSIYRAAPKELSTTTIRVASFEQWLKGLNGNFDLLKMDCEGAEWEIIQKTDPKQLRRFNVFVAEVHGDPLNKNSIQDFKPLIEGVGFRTIRWDAHAQGLYVGVRDSQDAQ